MSEDTRAQIKLEMTVNLMDAFARDAHQRAFERVQESGARFREQLRSAELGLKKDDFEITFLPRPLWTELLHREHTDELRRAISLDSELAGHAHCITRVASSTLALCMRSEKPNGLSARVIDVIKNGADQCSRQRPGVVWLHFVGAAEAEFNDLAQFSMSGPGAGLNSLVAAALHPQASSTDRSHVRRVLFSTSGESVARSPMLAPDLMMVHSASSGGPIYEVPNPFCRFSPGGEDL